MLTTTPADLHAAFVATIQAITASYPHNREKTWHYRPDMREVSGGGDMRWFYLVHDVGTPTQSGSDGFFFSGDGISYSYELRVVTCYSNAPTDRVDFIVDADAHDLWWTLDGQLDPSTPGLYAVEPLGTEQIDDGSGSVMFVHRFTVIYNRLSE